MTKNEAIEWLKTMKDTFDKYPQAIDMAIEALSIVRCKDCRRYESDGGALMTCTLTDMIVDDDCYCWLAERREP